MQLVVLIGFLYERDRLDSTYTDLYIIHKLCSGTNSRIVTISDTRGIPDVVVSNIVTSKIDTGITTYHPDTSEWYTVRTLNDLVGVVEQLNLELVDRLVIYYSGHCETGGLLRMPDDTLCKMIDFRDMILNRAKPDAQVMFIIDCCNADHLQLPYNYQCDRFVLQKDYISCSQNVLALVSCEEGQVAVSSHASFFTRHLVQVLDRDIIYIPKIIQDVTSSMRYSGYREVSDIKVQSSYYNGDVVWTWPYRKHSIVVDDLNGCFTINKYTD